MKLEEYLKVKKMSQKKIADMVGVTPAHITHILKKRKSPSLLLAKQIEEVTEGSVTVYDLIEPKAPSRHKVKKHGKEISVMGG